MATFVINEGLSDARTLEAEKLKTEGDFIDFTSPQQDYFVSNTVLRIRSDYVQTVERFGPLPHPQPEPLVKFRVNRSSSDEEKVIEAQSFATRGDFVDFTVSSNDAFDIHTVFRIRQQDVYTVERLDAQEPEKEASPQ